MSYYDLSSRAAVSLGVATERGEPFAGEHGDGDDLSAPRGLMLAAMLGWACWSVFLAPLFLLLS